MIYPDWLGENTASPAAGDNSPVLEFFPEAVDMAFDMEPVLVTFDVTPVTLVFESEADA